MSLKIYSYPGNYRVWKSQIAANYNQLDLELVPVDMRAGQHKTPEFLAKNPVGKVPVLETPQGCIFESGAIARYIARLRGDANLLGDNNFQQAQVDQWIDYCTNEIEPARAILYYPIAGFLAYNEKAATEARKEISAAFELLNKHLQSRTFLVGNHVTLADIQVVTSIAVVYTQLFGPKFASQYVNVLRYFNTCVNQPEFSKVIGKVEFAKEDAKPPKADKKADAGKPAGGDKKESGAASSAAPKKEAAPAKEAAAAPPKGENDDLLDELEAPKPKKVNPLDLLPESPMSLDSVKKLAFSQRPVLPTFFEQHFGGKAGEPTTFDPAGYVWYICEYNYNSDNKEYWKIGNTLGGFVQRSDACRKYAMGSMQVSGPEDEEGSGPWVINGAWLFRGQELPAEMKDENPDSEYYTWNKVDASTDAGRAKLKEYFLGAEVNGAKVLDRRYFK